MNRRALLRVTAFLLPALLAWIVILGEANRAFDRSEGLPIPVSAHALSGTSYSGPRLQVHAEVFESRPVKVDDFPPGSDLVLRYRRSGSGWTFEGARRSGQSEWSPSVIDVPARVELKRYPERAEAVPLLPAEFAISRSLIAQIRARAQVALVVRRGAMGNAWVASAMQTGDSLGTVAGLIDRSSGDPVAFGSIEPPIDPHAWVPSKAEGWIARFNDGKVDSFAMMPGLPLDSVQLKDGRLEVALRGSPYSSDGFDVVRIGSDTTAIDRLGKFSHRLVSLDSDGSVWAAPQNNPSGRLIHSEAAGPAMPEVALEPHVTVLVVRDDVAVGRNGDIVIRYRLKHGPPVETDRWTIDGLPEAILLDGETILAATRRRLVKLSAGVRDPVALFTPVGTQLVFSAQADETGNLVVSTVSDSSPNGYDPLRATRPQHFWFLPKGGTAVDLGDVGATTENNFDLERLFTRGQRVLLRGHDLFVASGSQILGFDLTNNRLALRITEQTFAKPKRIL